MPSPPSKTATLTAPLPKKAVLETTLYDLIASINETIPPEQDDLVTATVAHILDTARVSLPYRS